MPTFKQIRQEIRKRIPVGIYCASTNLLNKFQRRIHKLKPFTDGLIEISDDTHKIYISERKRHARYKRGILRWIEILANQYHLGRAAAEPGGVFIDCGANVGELGLWAKEKGLDYHPFEPESREATCCNLNNFDGQKKTNQCGLWHEETELKFYSKAESADSSFIEIEKFNDVKSVPVTTLDAYIKRNDIRSIEILKVEAEGAEPEVLRGAAEALKICRFVTVDCGCERGIAGDDTIRDVCNAVFASGFQISESCVSNARVTLLFERQSQRALAAA